MEFVGSGIPVCSDSYFDSAHPRCTPTPPQISEGLMATSDDKTCPTRATEMNAAAALTTKVLAIGTWAANTSPETRPPVMPSEARHNVSVANR
jgi:hypothetical protein